MIWQTSRFVIDLTRPQVMGIVNFTPDSFSDGGQCVDTASAIARCEQLLRDGADILDIGGESTRPGSPPLGLDEELARVVPLVRDAVTLGVPISVDTYKPEVMQAVLDLGADIVNDIWALRRKGEPGSDITALGVVRNHPYCGVCLMHMHRDPQTMQAAPMEGDVVPRVRAFLEQAARDLQSCGVQRNRIVLDPGIGFGKTVAQNYSLLARQEELLAGGWPLLIGWSRKSSIGAALQGAAPEPPPPGERVVGSVAAALLAAERGAHVLRVHDVRETVEALKIFSAMKHSIQ